jgi:hypothetical protein
MGVGTWTQEKTHLESSSLTSLNQRIQETKRNEKSRLSLRFLLYEMELGLAERNSFMMKFVHLDLLTWSGWLA